MPTPVWCLLAARQQQFKQQVVERAKEEALQKHQLEMLQQNLNQQKMQWRIERLELNKQR